MISSRTSLTACLVAGILGLRAGEAWPASRRATTTEELTAALAQAAPGDTITVASGMYTGPIVVAAAGTREARIVIASETLGGATLAGASGFRFAPTAGYVTLRGWKFVHGGTLTMDLGSHHLQVTRNDFQLQNASGAIRIQGLDQEVSYNIFQHKTSAGAMISVDASGRDHAGTQRPFIHHNHFLDHAFTGGNGGECIATWGQITRIEQNLFEKCNGDPEMISMKASDAFVRFNTFRDSTRGQFTLRYAKNVLVEGNFFINTRGMRMYGPGHKIINNHFENNQTGMAIAHATPTGYLPIQNMLIAHNTLVNSPVRGQGGQVAPDGVTFVNNILQGSSFEAGADWTNTKYEGNIASGGSISGMPAGGYRMVSPQLMRDGRGVFRPGPGSPAIDGAAGSYGVMTDAEGQPRDKADVGADEVSMAPASYGPLTAGDVGPGASGEVTAPPPPPADAGAPTPVVDAGGAAGAGGPRDAGTGGASGSGTGGAGQGGSGGAGGMAGGAGGRDGGASGGASGGRGGEGDGEGGGSPPKVRAAGGCTLAPDAGAHGFAALVLLAVALHRARRRSCR
jgi:poly(beta-D-mannuronate) lyase